jgi:hypothetical protein
MMASSGHSQSSTGPLRTWRSRTSRRLWTWTAAKANIVGAEPTPEQVRLGMRVRLTTFRVGTDSEGTEAIAFGYRPT